MEKKIRFIGRHLMVKGRYVEDILSGRKKATIRRGIVKPKHDEIIIHGGGRPVAKIRVSRVIHKRLYELTDEDALKDGFKSRDELLTELRRVYPDIRDDEWVTIIEFDIVQRLNHIEPEEPYLGLKPADIARIGLRYLNHVLSEEEKRILLDLTRTNSIRATTYRLYGDINRRIKVRKTLRKTLRLLIERGIIGRGEKK